MSVLSFNLATIAVCLLLFKSVFVSIHSIVKDNAYHEHSLFKSLIKIGIDKSSINQFSI